LQRKLGEAQQQLQRGSQQIHGESQEIVLRELLFEAFEWDRIDDVPIGMHGADVIQLVRTIDGREHGTMIWESKRTKAWSDDWLPKLRDDLRTAGATFAILVSQALPQDIRHFGERGGVWICGWPYATALAAALRAALLEVSSARRSNAGRGEKMQMVYDYLTGTEFRNRVSGLVEACQEMQHDLQQEQRAMHSLWKRREKQLLRARDNVSAFYGDLQGIAGRHLADLPVLALGAVVSDVQQGSAPQSALASPSATVVPASAPSAIPADETGAGSARMAETLTQAENAGPDDADLEDAELGDVEQNDPPPALFPHDRWQPASKFAEPRMFGEKRRPTELFEISEKLRAHIRTNPGQRIEMISRFLGVPTKDLALPTRKLLSENKIRANGQKRATRYYIV
jgi:hypothetical protein